MSRFPLALAALVACAAALRSSDGNSNNLAAGFSETAGARESALEEQWEKDLEANGKPSAIQRVVKLLKEMAAQLSSEAKSDAETYDRMVCWCETNEKEKTKAIADAEAKIAELVADMEKRSAGHGRLATMIEDRKDQVASDQASLEKARTIREKEAAEFSVEEKNMVNAIVNLKNAIIVLSKHHDGASLTQTYSPVLASLRRVLKETALKYDLTRGDENLPSDMALGGSILTKGLRSAGLALLSESTKTQGLAGERLRWREQVEAVDRTVLLALTDRDAAADSDVLPLALAESELAKAADVAAGRVVREGAFVQGGKAAPGSGESYSPRSSLIFGILKQMKEDFESTLSAEQKAEAKKIEEYKALSESLNKQIAAGKAKLDSLQAEFFANEKALTDAKEALGLTREQRSKDVEFLQNLRLSCQDLDHQWTERKGTRAEELKAVTEAIAILTEDDNADHLRKTVTLLQTVSVSSAELRARRSAASALRRAAQAPSFDADDLLTAWHGRGAATATAPRAQLSSLAVSVELDGFAKVKECMDKLIEQLKAEQKEEVELKSFCISEFDKTEKMTYKKTEQKADLEARIEHLASLVTKVEEEIAAATTSIAEAKSAVKEAGAVREAENKEYQTTVADQRATQAILKKAHARLAAFYNKALLQKDVQTPPVQFTPYKKSGGSASVMGLLEQIIEDSKATEAAALKGETEAQAAYEAFVKDSNAEISMLQEQITAKTEASEQAKLETATAQSDLTANADELESLESYEADLHAQCDFILKNFDIRQRARQNEIDAIQEAKAILSGME